MRVVAGLGNPGEEYAGTRHNVGFAVVRELAERWRMRWTNGAAARIASGEVDTEPVMLIEPQLYMNRSGEALMQAGVTVEPRDLLVIHDEIDLPRGRIRVKVGGGSAGHRGINSIAEHYGTEFVRVRVGVGRPAGGGGVVDHVLAPFDESERAEVATAVASAADAVECILKAGPEAAMQRFNGRQPESNDEPVVAGISKE
jgi:PTH1 family peptidyl-tRNA hydrolase